MSFPVRGRCLIINNRDFASSSQLRMDKREGSDMDVINICNVFTQLHFCCEIHTNLSGEVSEV